MIALAGADPDNPEARAGAYLLVEFFANVRHALTAPSKKTGKTRPRPRG